MKDLRCLAGLHNYVQQPRIDGSVAHVCSRCSKQGRPWNGNVAGAARAAKQAQESQLPPRADW